MQGIVSNFTYKVFREPITYQAQRLLLLTSRQRSFSQSHQEQQPHLPSCTHSHDHQHPKNKINRLITKVLVNFSCTEQLNPVATELVLFIKMVATQQSLSTKWQLTKQALSLKNPRWNTKLVFSLYDYRERSQFVEYCCCCGFFFWGTNSFIKS